LRETDYTRRDGTIRCLISSKVFAL